MRDDSGGVGLLILFVEEIVVVRVVMVAWSGLLGRDGSGLLIAAVNKIP